MPGRGEPSGHQGFNNPSQPQLAMHPYAHLASQGLNGPSFYSFQELNSSYPDPVQGLNGPSSHAPQPGGLSVIGQLESEDYPSTIDPRSPESSSSPLVLSHHASRGLNGPSSPSSWHLPSPHHPDDAVLAEATIALQDIRKVFELSIRQEGFPEVALFDFQRALFQTLSVFANSGLLDRSVDYDTTGFEREYALLCLRDALDRFYPPDLYPSLMNTRHSAEGLLDLPLRNLDRLAR
jgi:hypothetical protein